MMQFLMLFVLAYNNYYVMIDYYYYSYFTKKLMH